MPNSPANTIYEKRQKERKKESRMACVQANIDIAGCKYYGYHFRK